MGFGKCGWVIAKGKQTKGMRKCASFRAEVSGERSLRGDHSESVLSVRVFQPCSPIGPAQKSGLPW
jgi:hypothetical protein